MVNVSYRWCRNNCRGWQISRNSKLNQWISPFVGFLVPSVVFCLAIPRRRKLRIPEVLFDIALNEITTHFRTPFVALSAALLVTIDTISWLMTIFALSGPILVSGIYEALIDARILAFLQEKIRNKRLSTAQRSRLLYTILVGNLDMLSVPSGEHNDNSPLSHVNGLLKKLERIEIEYKCPHNEKSWFRTKAVNKTKTRLRSMLAAQYSFGVTVGAPVIFFCVSFCYTLVDNFSSLGNNNTSHALGQYPESMILIQSIDTGTAFGMWWMIVPHIAIVSGLLLAGNNPNTLEGVVSQPTAQHQAPHHGIFELVYDSRYTPNWVWQRGRSKKIWVDRVCYDQTTTPDDLSAKVKLGLGDWMVIGFFSYSLLLFPSVLAFLTSFYTPPVGLSCRSMTFLLYMICQFYLTVLWIWDIHSTYLDSEGAPHTPVTRVPWAHGGVRDNWQAYLWWPNVLASGACAIFTAIGGTMLQIIGVFRNCLCTIPMSQWRRSAFDSTFPISTNSAEAIQNADTYWRGSGVTAITFLSVISYVGWWYQRRLRYQFKLLVDRIDWGAEDP